MKQSESIAKLAAALVAAQSELRAVAKDATNPHFKSKFASLDAIIEQVRPVLAKHELALVQGATSPDRNEAGVVTAFTVETMLVHSSGEWLIGAAVMPLAKSDPQGAGAALTYGRRYSLSSLLCLATDEDDDGNVASKRSAGERGGKAQAATASGASLARPSGSSPAPSAQPALVLTRESKLPFGPQYTDWRIAELPYAYLQWATDKERKPTAFGPHTAEWRRAFQQELDGRAAGDCQKQERAELAGV